MGRPPTPGLRPRAALCALALLLLLRPGGALPTPRRYETGGKQAFLLEYTVPACDLEAGAPGPARVFYTPFVGTVDQFDLYSALPCSPAEAGRAEGGPGAGPAPRAQVSRCFSSLVSGQLAAAPAQAPRACLEAVSMRVLTPLEAVYDAEVGVAGSGGGEGEAVPAFEGDASLLLRCPGPVLELAEQRGLQLAAGDVLRVSLAQRLDGARANLTEGRIGVPLLAASARIRLLGRGAAGEAGEGGADAAEGTDVYQVSEPTLLVELTRGVVRYEPRAFFCTGGPAAPDGPGEGGDEPGEGGDGAREGEEEIAALLELERVVRASLEALAPSPDAAGSGSADSADSASTADAPEAPLFSTSLTFDTRDSCSSCDGCVETGGAGFCAARLEPEGCAGAPAPRCYPEPILQLAWLGEDATGRALVSEGQTLHHYRSFAFWTHWPSSYDKVRRELGRRAEP